MKKGMLTLAALLLGSNVVHAEVVRYPIPNSTFPIAQAARNRTNVTANAKPSAPNESTVPSTARTKATGCTIVRAIPNRKCP